MYDITIIGAGPAGATLARLLGNKYKILVLDRRELISHREGSIEKCCGGLIAPDAQRMLGKLGLGVPGEVLVGPQLFTVRTIDIQNELERYYQRNYINIDREKFDSWLVSLIPPTVDIRCGVFFKSYEIDGGAININFHAQGKRYTEKTKFLVGADGANSLLRRQLTGSKFQKTYITVQEWFSVKQNQPYFSAIFDNDISDFYSWSIPKENFLIVGAALTPKENVSQKFGLLKKRLINLGFELNESSKKTGAFLLRPQNAKQIFIGRDKVLLIGEAAGWISPTSAEGLSYSFRSAIALADSFAANPESPIADYHKNTRGLRLNILLKNLKSPFMYDPFIRKIVMKSGLSSMSIYK
jgi:flavin-dependent dehydrogenase